MKRWLLWLPLGGFLILFGLVAVGLVRPAERTIASQLVGEPLPAIVLPPLVPGHPGFAASTPGPRLVNIFASWCVPCAVEVGELQRRGPPALAEGDVAAGPVHLDGRAVVVPHS